MNAARSHTDGEHHEGDTTRVDLHAETPSSLAAKIEAVGHVSPSIQMTSEEARAHLRQRWGIDADDGDESMRQYLRARDEYLRHLHRRPTLADRIGVVIANLWHKIWGGVVLIVATTFLTIGLCAQDVPDWCLRGIAHVETSSKWRDIGEIRYVDRRIGADGEVGPWQLSPAALTDMGVLHLRARIHREPVLAESMTRAWLLRCYRRTGDWFEAVAIYHTGPRGDVRRGHNYAARVRAAGITN